MNEDGQEDAPKEGLETLVESETLSEAAQRARDEAAAEVAVDEEFQEFVLKFFGGELTYVEWKRLPREQQVAYRDRHKGKVGHTRGVPQQRWEKDAQEKKARKRRKARRRAHRSRMTNHLRG